jgi:GT2 family glycosyltransferase
MITAHRRIDESLKTIARIRACSPAPEEVVVHVDGGETVTADSIVRAFPDVRVLTSAATVGPGGGRNAVMAAATQPIVASFDDDSYPIDADYFARVTRLFDEFPDAGVVDAYVFHLNQAVELDFDQSEWVADFSGGACAYRRERFLETGGYVPLPVAYGMEEVDFGLRFHAAGGRILRSRRLRVFHNTDLGRHADAAVTAASIANIALLAYLRYPRWLWAVGGGQCLKRMGWLIRHGRWRGIAAGLIAIPRTLGRYRQARRPISARALRSYFRLRRHPIAVGRALQSRASSLP